jgi:hypothetical protein
VKRLKAVQACAKHVQRYEREAFSSMSMDERSSARCARLHERYDEGRAVALVSAVALGHQAALHKRSARPRRYRDAATTRGAQSICFWKLTFEHRFPLRVL